MTVTVIVLNFRNSTYEPKFVTGHYLERLSANMDARAVPIGLYMADFLIGAGGVADVIPAPPFKDFQIGRVRC